MQGASASFRGNFDAKLLPRASAHELPASAGIYNDSIFGDPYNLTFRVLFRCSGGSRRCRAASKDVPGGQGKPRAPEWWPESSGRSLDDDVKPAVNRQTGYRRENS